MDQTEPTFFFSRRNTVDLNYGCFSSRARFEFLCWHQPVYVHTNSKARIMYIYSCILQTVKDSSCSTFTSFCLLTKLDFNKSSLRMKLTAKLVHSLPFAVSLHELLFQASRKTGRRDLCNLEITIFRPLLLCIQLKKRSRGMYAYLLRTKASVSRILCATGSLSRGESRR